MFKNYFKTAIRNLARNKNYTIINIAGLASGIAVCLVIFIIIQFEMSYDNFHAKKDRIYRVLTEYHHADAAEIFYGQGVPFPMPAGLRANFPQLEKVSGIYHQGNAQILVLDENGNPGKKFKEEKGTFYAEPAFFEIFDFPLIAGNSATALQSPNSAVISKETAEKYFGDWQSAIGKTFRINMGRPVKITGVLANIPSNTDFQIKLAISYGTGMTEELAKFTNWDGTNSAFGCFVLAKPGFNMESFNTQLRAFSKKMKAVGDNDSHIIEPLKQVHFDSKIGDFSGKTISVSMIRVLWIIAGFILLIACVNFINLSTAQAVHRAREVGVRKVLGSNRYQLRLQFIAETCLIVVLSMLLAGLISLLVIAPMGKVVDLPLRASMLNSDRVYLFLASMTIIVTLLAGFYPSLVLSAFNPIEALKNKFYAGRTRGISLRRGLVVFQFIVAQALIIGTLIIVRQMNYFMTAPLGFDKEAIVNIPVPPDSVSNSKLEFVRKQLASISRIKNVSFSSNTPVEDDNDNWSTFGYDHAPKETDFFAITKLADNHYLPTYNLPLVAGRNLEPSDTGREFIVNEKLVKSLGILDPHKVLGKQINLWNGYIKGPIVGVLKDFNARSFRRELAPVIITTLRRGYDFAGIKLSSSDIPGSMKAIENIWATTFPDFVFEYQFLDAKVDSFYRQEKQLSDLYKIFAVIAIFLSCLGLYGLASFMAVQRVKEVGIRKVLGATAGHIVYLFSKEFVLLITIAFVIASPIAWYFMNKWLQDYPYRIHISWWIFILGATASILIALATVSFQAVKAAISNPVKSLRTE
ncbi:MAG TPA: ABC transporter permease [Puia sp.]|nr:ABC transporter permease [Puia sp.]